LKKNYFSFFEAALLVCLSMTCFGQDPHLPPTNLGTANVNDGMAGKPGFIYQGFTQFFQTRNVYDQNSNKVNSDLKVNSILQLNQVIYQTPVRVFGGNLVFTVLFPVVQITSSENGRMGPATNSSILGDVIQGTAIQWSDRKLFGKPFSHRAEFDVSLPTGNYSARYDINPSAHSWSYGVYHALTLVLNGRVSMSTRNQLNYNTHFIGSGDKAGAFYNGNYSIDYSILPTLKIEAVAYYLKQLNQDSYNGDHHYYQNQFGISDTKEKVLGAGPGMAYFAPGGVLIEGKVFFETAARNRLSGTRPTIRLLIPLSK